VRGWWWRLLKQQRSTAIEVPVAEHARVGLK